MRSLRRRFTGCARQAKLEQRYSTVISGVDLTTTHGRVRRGDKLAYVSSSRKTGDNELLKNNNNSSLPVVPLILRIILDRIICYRKQWHRARYDHKIDPASTVMKSFIVCDNR